MRDFDTLEPQGFEFTYRKKLYVLREAPESTVIKYRAVVTSNVKYDMDGKPQSINAGGMVGLNALLVAGCTFERVVDARTGQPTGEERGPIAEALVSTWPHSVVDELAAEADRLTPGLKGGGKGDGDEGAEKNAPAAPPSASAATSASPTS